MPSVCTVFVTLVQCFRVACAGNVSNFPVFILVLVPLVQCFAWSSRAMYLFARVRTRTGTPCTVLRLVSPGNVPTCPCSVLVLVSLVQCFAWSARAMCLFARVRTRTMRESLHSVYCACTPCIAFPWASPGNLPICPSSYSYWYPFVQCCAWSARAMYLYARAYILVQGNPSHVRILVFGLSRCTCSPTPIDMDSMLVMSRDGFYVRCICASCLYLTCRGAIVRLPVCTADREGGWQPR